ncbi:MAG TPA: hypothetical protein DCE78_11280 [Bacteroidetes bacterium]|nr:hypothetical protein [Bacteroidota bacterium]
MSQHQLKLDPIKTVLVITTGFLILYLVTDWQWTLTVSVVVGLSGIISKKLAEFINYIWMKLAWVLSLIIPNILMSAIFYLFLTPIALLSRVFGEPNQLNLKNTESSLFKVRNKEFSKSSFEKPF